MNANVELLDFIYRNSQMGVNTLEKLLTIVEPGDFKNQIQHQYDQYKKINEKANSKLEQNGHEEKGIGELNKIRNTVMIDVQTLADKSDSHIAEMLITGSNMGTIQATKKLHEYQKDAERDILSLMDKLLDIEEENVQKLKEYL